MKLGNENSNLNLCGYTDSDWGSDTEDRKSTGGFIFLFNNSLISWSSKKQTSTALSSTDSEFIAASEASRHAKWLIELFNDFHVEIKTPMTMYEDNQSCLKQIN